MVAINKKHIASTFGVALSSMYLAPDLQADILDITWNGGSASAAIAFSSGTFNFATFNIDQVVDGSNTAVDFAQFNDQWGGIGRTMIVGSPRAIASIQTFAFGAMLNAATFVGTSSLGGGTTFDGTGTRYVGFKSNVGNVGWFKMSFTDQGAIVFSTGEYGSMGENVTVGGTAAVPEPSTLGALGVLALGAVGLRRKRKEAVA